MGIVNNALSGASGQSSGYNLTNSLRFRQSANAYLSRSPSVTTTTRTAWTWSGWVKLGQFVATVSYNTMFSSGTSAFNYMSVNFTNCTANDQIVINADGYQKYYTNAVFRDPSAWYHVVVAFNSNASAGSRIIVYINGVQQTTVVNNEISSGFSSPFGVTTNPMYVGRHGADAGWSSFYYADFYLTEVNWIDGQALTPSSFGQTSTSTGVWIPKKYTGTYGTNGFYLPFTNTASTSTLGNDFSGNGNNWTTNNISLTAGSTYDSMTDVPTLTSATTANYCVLNPLSNPNGPIFTLSNGNLNYSCSASAGNGAKMAVISTMALHTGKVYWEILATNTNGGYGVSSELTVSSVYGVAYANVYSSTQASTSGITYSGTTFTYTTNDTLGFAWDGTALTLGCYKNGSLIGTFSGFSSTTVYFPQMQPATASASTTFSANFGQQPFAQTPPTGFLSLNTFNLPTPTIGATASTQASDYFNVVTWTGNGTSSGRSITGVGFQPDFVWGKARSVAYGHGLYDAVRGSGKLLVSNNTNSEATNFLYGYLSSFDSDGFTTTPGSSSNENWNQTNATYVAWNWKANGAGSTNTAGSITSTVSANTTAGFSIVTWTGNNSSATIGHGLGVTPQMIIWMHRTNPGAYHHGVYHASLPSAAYALQLSTSLGQSSDNNWWNSTAPTPSVFTVGGYNISDTMVAYCFAEVAGYSKIGKYTGTGAGDSNGPFIYCGFRPAFIIIKADANGYNWAMMDSKRPGYNSISYRIMADVANEETTVGDPQIDFLSNGFKLRAGISNYAGTVYYMAFAEHPFKYANAR